MGCVSPVTQPQPRYQPQPQPQHPQHYSSYQQPNPQFPTYPPRNQLAPLSNNPHYHSTRPSNVEINYNENDMMRRYGRGFRKNNDHLIDVKIPNGPEKIKFSITRQPMLLLPVEVGNYPITIIKNLCFQQKMTWLRIQVQKMRISWQSGCEWIQVDRQDVLMSSLHALSNRNLRRQLKIKLNRQQVDDAGGVLRQWMHLCIKDIFNSQIAGLFKLCLTDETSYRFIVENITNTTQDQYRMEVCMLLGIVIGKALFDRIPLDCFLTRSIWRQICNQSIEFNDFYSYDKQMYKHMKNILQTNNSQQLQMNFTYLAGDQTKYQILLKIKGDTINVNDTNKKQYVDLLINYLSVKSCQRYIKQIRKSINLIMPIELLSIFEPQQMQMLLNGPQNINVNDWKKSTEYINYKPTDIQIQWFWSYVQKLSQQKLGNLLHFVTGSRRVPILGFSYLQSNRNRINKFTIQRSQIENHNPYPKGHTCFNRLQLPTYPTQIQLNLRMDQILTSEINTFGMS